MTIHAAILGFGITGESVLRHMLRVGIEPVVVDTRPARPVNFPGVQFIWDAQQWPKLHVDYAVVSPGLALDSCLVAGAVAAGVPLRSDIDLFFEAVKEPVIGITGTNGKSTVTTLVGHILKHSGLQVGVGGNLGLAALDVIDESNTHYVLELSSFQLERSRQHAFHAAAILNISEDHLDKHATMDGYVNAKHQIYAQSRRCVYNRNDPLTQPQNISQATSFGSDYPPSEQDWGVQETGEKRVLLRGNKEICTADTLALPGAHNVLNALASCALVAGFVEDDLLPAALASFTGLHHRFEVVARARGVTYINDSKATNLGACLAALAGMPANNQVLLIAGGDAKGVDLSPLAQALENRVRHVVTLGKDGEQINQIAASVGIDSTSVATMAQAVSTATALAVSGDMVLLSPACASLDMFASYQARGDQFTAAARAACGLNERGAC
jgi:UDP-N-acetylmuramoylalanine--D-glutamate ligase